MAFQRYRYSLIAWLNICFIVLMLPYLSFGQDYFRGDKNKKVKIIQSRSGIFKIKRNQYALKGDIIIEIWDTKYFCDSAVFYRGTKKVSIYGLAKEYPEPQIHVFHCSNRNFLLKDGTVTCDCPAY